MEKPDSEGYVNVTWPSRNVPHGGIFHPRIAQHTEDQQQFLKILLEESKFSLKLRQNRAYGLRSDGSIQDSVSVAASRPPPPPTARPRTSRRRSLSAIRSSGVLDIDTFRPTKRGEDRERLKEKLANTMAYGESPDQQQLPPPLLRQKPAPKLPTTKETWNNLVTQIRERAEWLAEMEWLGHAAPHREIVEEQIAERMRALDALGIESVCSTARSTTRVPVHLAVRTPTAAAAQSPKSTGRSSTHSKDTANKSPTTKKPPHVVPGKKTDKPEENVTAFSKLSPLRYSPRRRV